jgi:predicted AlkP superfamily pyrophosphatase or phosphodiesterase
MLKPVLTACVVLAIASCSVRAADRPTKRVLLFGIDGCRVDALKDADPPHLRELIEHGAFSENTNILGTRTDKADTVSGPGWSNILTGVWADKHGVTDNAFKVKHYDAYPHFFVHVKEAFPGAHTNSYCVWPSIHDNIVAGADESICFATDPKTEPDCAAADTRCAAKAVEVLKNGDPDVMFVYFENVDATGHQKGFHRSVPEYVQAIHKADEHVGEVLAALRSRPNFKDENWLILVGTDHGGRGTGHGGGRESTEVNTVWLVVSGDAAKPGKIEGRTNQVDLVPTALTHLGVPIDPKWKLDGQPVGLKKPAAR